VRSKPGTVCVCVRTGTRTVLGPKIIYRYEQSFFNRVDVRKDCSRDDRRCEKVLLADSAAAGCSGDLSVEGGE